MVRTETIPSAQLLSRLPPSRKEDLLPLIQETVRVSRRKVIVLDDDPTGTQTVHSTPVLTNWTNEVLINEFSSSYNAFYILTNSRSLPLEAAKALNYEIGKNLKETTSQMSVEICIVSRRDSTLRGHFPGEVDSLAEGLEYDTHPYLIVPSFFEGGRITVDDIHYVLEDGNLIPVAQTPYARDSAFSFRSSNLKEWVEEKTQGRIPANLVHSISINDIREGGPGRVGEILSGLPRGSACIVNAANYGDLEVLVFGLLQAEEEGNRYLCRTAASFVRVRAGIEPKSLLGKDELTATSQYGGLFIIGSHVQLSTIQLMKLLKQNDIVGLKLEAERLLSDMEQSHEIQRVTNAVNKSIESGQDVVVYTSRELIKVKESEDNFAIGQRISDSLVTVVEGLEYEPKYLVAKGGITSSNIATKGLNVQRAIIIGQALPGVPVWKLGEECRFPGMLYVIFPGNVGEKDDLVRIKQIFG